MAVLVGWSAMLGLAALRLLLGRRRGRGSREGRERCIERRKHVCGHVDACGRERGPDLSSTFATSQSVDVTADVLAALNAALPTLATTSTAAPAQQKPQGR